MPNLFVAAKHGISHLVMSVSGAKDEADARGKVAGSGMIPVSVHNTHGEAIKAVEALNGAPVEVQPTDHPET